MASSGLRGPFALITATIDGVVTKTSPGAYALGWMDEDRIFRIQYVGRADEDVNKGLKDWAPTNYPLFKFEYYHSAEPAYRKECELFHDFQPPDNVNHPACPKGSNLVCLRCGR
jgi:hypothetical protein